MERENIKCPLNQLLLLLLLNLKVWKLLPLSHKIGWNLAICKTWMGLEGITLSEVSQAEKEKYHMISLTCGI